MQLQWSLGYEEQKPQIRKERKVDNKERRESHEGPGQEEQVTQSAAGVVFIFWPLSDHRLEVLELISTFFNTCWILSTGQLS